MAAVADRRARVAVGVVVLDDRNGHGGARLGEPETVPGGTGAGSGREAGKVHGQGSAACSQHGPVHNRGRPQRVTRRRVQPYGGHRKHGGRALDTNEADQPGWQALGAAVGIESMRAEADPGDPQSHRRRRALCRAGHEYPQSLAGADQRVPGSGGRSRGQGSGYVYCPVQVGQLVRAVADPVMGSAIREGLPATAASTRGRGGSADLPHAAKCAFAKAVSESRRVELAVDARGRAAPRSLSSRSRRLRRWCATPTTRMAADSNRPRAATCTCTQVPASKS